MDRLIREAMHYEKLDDNKLRCRLCPHFCVISEGARGKCRSRLNSDGKLWAINYGKSIGTAVDPIEKKPLYHFRPNSQILSLGPNSCNLSCNFCQNYMSSQYDINTDAITIDELYEAICRVDSDIKQVAFTYTEPFTWYEFIYDFAKQYPDVDIVLISNGFINPEPLREILPMISAMNIDLKSFNAEFYHELCGGKLDAILESIKLVSAAGVHLEITLLMIPGKNDSAKEIEEIAGFIAAIDENIPLHISAYRPAYLSEIQATNVNDVIEAIAIAQKHLRWVYGGNLPAMSHAKTLCPQCETLLVERNVWYSESRLNSQDSCPKCGLKVYGIFT